MRFYNIIPLASLAALAIACGGNTPKESPEATPTAVAEEPTEVVIAEPEEVATGDPALAEYIVISKETMTLHLYDSNDALISRFEVATGKNPGNKQRSGDMKTPEGEFTIQEIVPAAHWTHDFGDGKGVIEGCYGNWFIRLYTPPHKGIGIHGTHAPESIGTRATEGCIHLHNNELDSLKVMVRPGMRVVIEAGSLDREADGVATPEEPATEPVAPKPVETTTKDVKAEAPKSEPATPKSTEGEVWHTVVDGDLVGRIAQKYGTTTAEIRRLNPDIDIDRISIGQRIKVKDATSSSPTTNPEAATPAQPAIPEVKPEAASTAEPAAKEVPATSSEEVWHTVVDGDLVGRIAQKYGTTSAKIAELNPDINIDRISIGQRIRVK